MEPRTLLPAVLVVVSALLACKSADKSQQESQPASNPLAAPTVPTGSNVTFVKLVPKSGTRASVSRKTTSKFTLSGKTYRETSTTDAKYTVKASDEFRVVKADVEVKELFTTSQEGTGTEKKSVSPLSGSTYTITRYDDGKLGAVDSGGTQVPASTLKLINEEFKSMFDKNNDGAFLPDRPVKMDEKFMPSSDALLKMLAVKDDGKTSFDGAEFILKSHSGSTASFDTEMSMTQNIGNGLRLRVKFKGTLDFQPQGTWSTAAHLKGPMTLLNGKGDEKGTGDVAVEITQTFE